ncbi:Organic cation/carnitine transporter 3 [Zostera marina]|uniref:Organic cation/carnitine transporter 3 n=1 Tax=Zostera marina TaxID=29655 RepID=A0A0K9NRE8_ZOSMR|nr:Organic cation/carnitine transporter 3 [Zostera marina]
MEKYSAPLLHDLPPSTKSDDENPPTLRLRPSLDHAIEQCVGTMGTAQLFQAFIISIAWIFDAQQTFISVFVDRTPDWHCTNTTDDTNYAPCSTTANTFCAFPQSSWSWDEASYVSTVSEWNLECYGGGSINVAGFPASAFFAGCLFGGILLATLGDSTLGRKKMLCFTSLAMSAIGIVTAFSPNVWIYTFLRFLTGFARATIGTSALVLAVEIVGSKWRGQVSILGFFLFTFGFISLPGIAYATEGSTWRSLYLWTSLPAFGYSVLIFFFVHESPRWLLVRGRREEAIQILKTMGSSNGHSLTMSFYNLVISDDVGDSESAAVGDLYSALKVLVGSRWASRRLAAAMTVAFGVGLLYYGIPLGVGHLDFNLYLIVTFNAISELPSLLLTLLYVDRLNRRSTMLMLTTASGAASLACVFVTNTLVQMMIEVSAFFGTITAFNLMLIYTLELFPTCVRNSAVAMVRQALVLGGVFSPMLIAIGRTQGIFWSFGMFGFVIGSCGLFTVCLPETRGTDICDTMDEQELCNKI